MHFGTFTFVGDAKYKFVFPEGSTLRAPRWDIHDEYPPLSPRQAGRAAREVLDVLIPDSGAALRAFQLAQAWGPGRDDCYWYYLIEFQVPDADDIGADDTLVEIPVLMNGVVPRHVLVGQ